MGGGGVLMIKETKFTGSLLLYKNVQIALGRWERGENIGKRPFHSLSSVPHGEKWDDMLIKNELKLDC